MRGIARWILRHRRLIIGLFVVLVVVSALAATRVKTNYNMADYLPQSANSTVSLNLMRAEFSSEPSNLRIMLPGASIARALAVKEQIAALPHVKDVSWLDDSADITTPLDMIDSEIVDAWYKGGDALITAYVEDTGSRATLEAIRGIIGEDAAMAGDIVQTNESRVRASAELAKLLAIAVPIILVILLFSTTSYVEPLLFMATIGVAIALGKGTDLIFGQVSFVTSSCSAILQLATSMDYAIFLLESFEEYRAQGLDVEDAMAEAMTRAFSSILSSSLTTIFGFLALTLMQFRIGYDMGMVLAKGIVLSLISVLVLLPVLAITFDRAIERTHHRKFIPPMKRFGRVNARICIPVLLVLGTLVVYPSILASARNDFIYGLTGMITDPSVRIVQEENTINARYERRNQMVLMVPYGQPAREQKMLDELEALPEITSIIAYATQADTTIPVDFVGRDNLNALIGEHYSRMILTADTASESEEAFALVESIRAIAERYYPGDNYLTGGTSNIYDMRTVVRSDDLVVNWLSLAAIGAILLFNFKSLSLPFILLSVIKSSIYINLAVLYFTGEPLYYLSLLIINAVQLGATVDYGILFTDRYMENRRAKRPMAAVAETVSSTFASVLTSSAILFTGGTALGMMSSVAIIRQLGYLVGRGALISAGMVMLALPAMLLLFDPLIRVTTIGARFRKRVDTDWERRRSDEAELDAAYRAYIAGALADDGVGGDEE